VIGQEEEGDWTVRRYILALRYTRQGDVRELRWDLAKREMEGKGMPWKEAEESKMLIAIPLRHVHHQTKALQRLRLEITNGYT
jgi:hypothetical protein